MLTCTVPPDHVDNHAEIQAEMFTELSFLQGQNVATLFICLLFSVYLCVHVQNTPNDAVYLVGVTVGVMPE